MALMKLLAKTVLQNRSLKVHGDFYISNILERKIMSLGA